jgi:hypothetical protein
MGLSIQHLPGDNDHLSCLQIENLVKHARSALPAGRQKALQPMLDAINTSGVYPPHQFTRQQVVSIRDALREAADRLDKRPLLRGRREARGWAELARDVATAADTAARSGKPWRWS